MGKKSREKQKRKQEGISGKQLKDMRRNAQSFEENGKIYNPLKKLCQARIYKSQEGNDILSDELARYGKYINAQKNKKQEND